MHARAVVRKVVGLTQACQQVVGGKDGVLANLPKPLGSMHADVGIGANMHAEVSVERVDLSDGGLRPSPGVLWIAPLVPRHDRPRKKSGQMCLHANWAGTRAASTMRGREGLVQVEVHDVDAEIARPGYAQDRVEVRPVVVNQAPDTVDDLDDLVDVLIP